MLIYILYNYMDSKINLNHNTKQIRKLEEHNFIIFYRKCYLNANSAHLLFWIKELVISCNLIELPDISILLFGIIHQQKQ